MAARKNYTIRCDSTPENEFDEFFAEKAFVHIERMGEMEFWIGIQDPGLPQVNVRTGVTAEGKWYFRLEEDTLKGARDFAIERDTSRRKK